MANIKSIGGNPIVPASVEDGSITTAKLADGAVTDDKLAQTGGVLEALGREAAPSLNLFGGTLVADTCWNCWTATVYQQEQNGYKRGEFSVPSGTTHISMNSYWANNSFSAFVDDSYNKIGLVRDNAVTQGSNGYIYTVPSGATRVCFSYNGTDPTLSSAESLYGIVIVSGNRNMINASIEDYPYGTSIEYFADNLRLHSAGGKLLSDVFASKEFTVKKDGSGDFASLVSAINHVNNNNIMDATIYIGEGEWDIVDELGSTYMESVTSSPSTWGLVLKNRVRLIGSSNSIVKANYTGSNTNTKQYFSVFNAGKLGFTLENVNIEDSGIRYSVHDDRGSDSFNEQYANRYINCSMKHTNGQYTDCIGGGLGINGLIEIANCYFEGDDAATRLVYYHGNNYRGATDAQCKIICKGNYFAGVGTFGLTKYGDSTKVSKAYVSDNSVGSALFFNPGSYAPQDNMQMIAWNNEVRS